MCRIAVAEQFTDDRMPMKLRVPTRPSARTKPWNVARRSSGTYCTGRTSAPNAGSR